MVADKNSVTKEQHERHKKILDALLKLPENRCCADCGSRGPRWASVNLGVFLCIQCSGIHRSLGVHISQVRSATLDTWLPDQVAFIQTMGNQKANEYWEADLPSNFKRPSEQDRTGVESFIRAKYERKAFVARERRRSKEDRPASRHEGGYSSDNGPASRLAHDERRAGGGSLQAAAKPTIAVKVPIPRTAAQPTTPVAAPHVAVSTAPPHKVESAPALIDLLSLNDTTPAKPPTLSTAAAPAAAPASTAGNSGGWAAFPEPTGASGAPGKAAPPLGVATSAATSVPTTTASAGTMSALTDLFTASTPGGPSQAAPAAPPVAATPEKPKRNATDIMSLFDQGSPLMNPQQAQLQQQMLYMQQQHLGGMPGGFPGGMPGVLPGTRPGAQLGAMPGVQPGAMPGVQPGAMPGVHPGAMPGMFPQPVPHGTPEAPSSHVGGAFIPQMAGYAPYGQGVPSAGFSGFYPGAPQPGFQGPYGAQQPSGPLGGLGGPEQYQPQAPVAAPAGPGHKDAPGAQYDFSDLQAFAK